MQGNELTGVRVLIVEDEFLLGFLLADDLRHAGCVAVGPFSTLAKAMDASRREVFDLAILDINLNGEMVFPLADELAARGAPFLFLTGYGAQNLPERYRVWPRVPKPYDTAALMSEMRRTLQRARAGNT